MSKNLLLTGATGFLGKTIAASLTGYNIFTLGRNNGTHYPCDLSHQIPVLEQQFDIVVHAAGKAHTVPGTEQEKEDFFRVNHVGTLHLLKALEKKLPRAFVLISTVAVYGLNTGRHITEDAPLLATDPYGSSKILAEEAVLAWCREHQVKCTIFRLPLLAGAHPPGNLGAMIEGIRKKRYANISGGKARKSMVLAKDVAAIIPVAAGIGGTYNLTDGHHPSFRELGDHIAAQLHMGKVLNIPSWIAYPLAIAGNVIGDKFPFNTRKLKKIMLDLTFDDSMAKKKLNWNPTPVLKGFNVNG
ncbi:NAD-dependent epimerase/dehydratase family protein [Chitinophaga sp. Mgbs1]|uniref:NAD-dependent epimerase/dehydratase family protein n=1 Tax=Chitinophaga solisilvae TaxID=1233460 RepID=A0A3S1CXT1_9BACT|nr:NAD-dependent epimerase/dehydratase family protein [Chitinophaga solisilvae]